MGGEGKERAGGGGGGQAGGASCTCSTPEECWSQREVRWTSFSIWSRSVAHGKRLFRSCRMVLVMRPAPAWWASAHLNVWLNQSAKRSWTDRPGARARMSCDGDEAAAAVAAKAKQRKQKRATHPQARAKRSRDALQEAQGRHDRGRLLLALKGHDLPRAVGEGRGQRQEGGWMRVRVCRCRALQALLAERTN